MELERATEAAQEPRDESSSGEFGLFEATVVTKYEAAVDTQPLSEEASGGF